jgi:hypothetical protein
VHHPPRTRSETYCESNSRFCHASNPGDPLNRVGCSLLGVGANMLRRLIRLVLAAVLAFALIGSGLVQGILPAQAAVTGANTGSHHWHPCESMVSNGHATSKTGIPACMTDLGCLLVVAIPAATPERVAQPYAWAQVSYWSRTAIGHGITSEPAIGPPIFVA